MENDQNSLAFAEAMISNGYLTLRPLVNRCAAGCGRQISDNRILCMRCLTLKRAEFEAKLDRQESDRAKHLLDDEQLADIAAKVAAFGPREAAAEMVKEHDAAVAMEAGECL